MASVSLKDFEGLLFVNALGLGLPQRCLENSNECVLVLVRLGAFQVTESFEFIFDPKVHQNLKVELKLVYNSFVGRKSFLNVR